ncbi:hypothetical protein FO519_001753 [Halicephalobus sp. NKZ332]|nr:hypothetical protein FO519_001753 [Halicephalobus sp. NKZ332]
MSDDSYGDFSQYNADSVPEGEKPIQHTHPGRPDLDYDDTPVGTAPEVRECQEEEYKFQHNHRHNDEPYEERDQEER